MNILVLGSGGREHVLAWKLLQSRKYHAAGDYAEGGKKLFVAPGNAGTQQIAQNVSIDVNDFEKIAAFSKQNDIGMIVVGPEAPLVEGIWDYFNDNDDLHNINIIGPSKLGAQLEGSKDFAKNFMRKYGIPTAKSKTFTRDSLQEGLEYIESHGAWRMAHGADLSAHIVLKADGLAAGKGVIIADSVRSAKSTFKEMLTNEKFGKASAKVVIEEYLDGIEVSVFVITDGSSYKLLPEAKDYKRIGEGDTGLNTGGMGAVSPVPFADKNFMSKVTDRIIDSTIKGLQKENIDYCGFIYFGLMNVNGDPYVIEYNVRLGDPEAEVVLPRIKTDLVDIFSAAAEKRLSEINIEFDERTAAAVMLVSEGYPGTYLKGKEITGLGRITNGELRITNKSSFVMAFHAGTTTNGNGKVVTNGGRVLALSALGSNMKEALHLSNAAAEIIDWEGKCYRKDIGFDLTD
ncbi:MAG: phosphoribosylamine--glycine ligase [Bacteroidetes bacterium]|nr:phosphoribosylamine--glycine ligase [Bacteroidota bacterium]